MFPVQRRNFLKTSCAALASLLKRPSRLIAASTADISRSRASAVLALHSVNPAIGTGWHGHMFPGAVAPFGLVQLSPDTAGPPERRRGTARDNYGWDHCSGYHDSDNIVVGFSHTHLQGTGGVDLGDLLLIPVTEGRNWSWDQGLPDDQAQAQFEALGQNSGWTLGEGGLGYCSIFSHDTEAIQPSYYAVHLETPDVHAELTATTRCGVHRYRFPASMHTARHGLLLDLLHGLAGTVYQSELKIESTASISGKRCTHGWASDKQVFFFLELSRPFAAIELQIEGKAAAGSVGTTFSGNALKAILTIPDSADPLIVRVGLSCTSVEGASKNLAVEVPHWDFDALVKDNQRDWAMALSSLDAELVEPTHRDIFYTGAYHGLVAPATFNDVDGTFRGQDHQNHPNPGFTKYSILSIWDIYRGEFPFLTLMQPQRTNDIVRTLLVDYEQLGLRSLPMWTLWGNETWSMRPGFHAAAMILGAYVRGFRDWDVNLAYRAIRDSALVGPVGKDSREARAQFRELGYIPATQNGMASASCTLDLAYDYWCAGAMADLLGKRDDAAMFYKLGQNYRNVFDPASNFMRGRTQTGQWTEPFRPDRETQNYVETDAWQASFSVPHDIQGLISLMGGDENFIAKLDELFQASSYVIDARPDISGMVGQDAQGNEPSNHIPYLYAFAGAPWKTQYWVRQVARLYRNTPAGIPGNDDCGQLSSWFVFSALGFYPVNAATGVYVIGSPLVQHATIVNSNKQTRFHIVAEQNSPENIFIQSVTLNGAPLERSWISHEELIAGGELRFRMASSPNKAWGSQPAHRPPSGIIGKP